MATTEQRIEQLAKKFSYRLRSFSDDANDSIAEDFQRRASGFLQLYSQDSFPKYGGRLSIHFRFVEKVPGNEEGPEEHGLDAWATPLFGEEQDTFVIFVSIALLRGISDVFTAIAFDGDKLTDGITTADMEEKFANNIYPGIASALTFIFFHELAHVVRVHIPFFFPASYRKGSGRAMLAFHLVKPKTVYKGTSLPPDDIRIHRSMEIDADMLAIGFIHQFLSTGDVMLYEGPEMNHAGTFGKAIAVTTRLLEQWRRSVSREPYDPQKSYHPHPDIRYIFLTSWLMARRKMKDTDKKFLKTTKKFQQGFDSANAAMDKFGTQFFPLFEYLEEKGRNAALEEYELLRTDLEEFLKPQLSDFKVR